MMRTEDVVELVGALTILVAFTAAQAGRLDQKTVRYQVANMLGSGILAVLALREESWGFLLLEGSWSVVSLAGLAVVIKNHASPATRDPKSEDDQDLGL